MVNLILENICHSSLISFKIMQPRAANCHQCSFMIYNENVLVVVTILGSKNQKRKVELELDAVTGPMKVERENHIKASFHNKSWQKRRQKSSHSIFDKSQWQWVRSILEMIYLIGSQGHSFHLPHRCAPQCQLKYCSAASLRSVLESKSVWIELLARIIHLIAQ